MQLNWVAISFCILTLPLLEAVYYRSKAFRSNNLRVE